MSDGTDITTGPLEGETIYDYQRRMQADMYAKGVEAADAAHSGAVGRANAAYHKIAADAEKAKNSEMEYAGVLYERMKKYLPLQQKQAGMGNMGISQTGLNHLTSSHMNRRSAIQGNYNDAISDANDTRASAIGLADQTRATAISNLDSTNAQALMEIYLAEDEANKEAKQAEIDAFMNNLNVYSDAKAALKAFGEKFGTDSEEYSTYQAEIEGYFEKANKEALDNHYDMLVGVLETAADKATFDAIITANKDIIENFSPEQKAHIEAMKTNYEGYEEQSNFDKIKEEINALIDEYASTEKIEEWLEKLKGIDGEVLPEYVDFYNEIQAKLGDPAFQYLQLEARNSAADKEKELQLLQAASNEGYNDVDVYRSDVLAGEEGIKTKDFGDVFIKDGAPAAIIGSRGISKDELDKLGDGSVEYLYGPHLNGWFVKFDGKWYKIKQPRYQG